MSKRETQKISPSSEHSASKNNFEVDDTLETIKPVLLTPFSQSKKDKGLSMQHEQNIKVHDSLSSKSQNTKSQHLLNDQHSCVSNKRNKITEQTNMFLMSKSSRSLSANPTANFSQAKLAEMNWRNLTSQQVLARLALDLDKAAENKTKKAEELLETVM